MLLMNVCELAGNKEHNCSQYQDNSVRTHYHTKPLKILESRNLSNF